MVSPLEKTAKDDWIGSENISFTCYQKYVIAWLSETLQLKLATVAAMGRGSGICTPTYGTRGNRANPASFIGEGGAAKESSYSMHFECIKSV